jgi:hypothetical protein
MVTLNSTKSKLYWWGAWKKYEEWKRSQTRPLFITDCIQVIIQLIQRVYYQSKPMKYLDSQQEDEYFGTVRYANGLVPLPKEQGSSTYYRVIKKSTCTWWLQYRTLQVRFKVSPASLQTFIFIHIDKQINFGNNVPHFHAACTRVDQMRPTGGPHNSIRNRLRAARVYTYKYMYYVYIYIYIYIEKQGGPHGR